MAKYSPKQKAAYFNQLRANWKKSKVLSDSRKTEIEAIMQEVFRTGITHISFYGIGFVWAQMKSQGFDGIPFVDAKTFLGWKSSGFRVHKGEKSTITGITWVAVVSGKRLDAGEEHPENIDYLFPKAYHLFHRSQVEEI